MEHTRIVIEVLRNAQTPKERVDIFDSSITIGSSKEATIRIESAIAFLFTFIHVDREKSVARLYFTNGMFGSVRTPEGMQTFAELRHQHDGVPTLGIWSIELPTRTHGAITIDDVEIHFAIERVLTALAEDAA